MEIVLSVIFSWVIPFALIVASLAAFLAVSCVVGLLALITVESILDRLYK